jgi:hypothetical protein
MAKQITPEQLRDLAKGLNENLYRAECGIDGWEILAVRINQFFAPNPIVAAYEKFTTEIVEAIKQNPEVFQPQHQPRRKVVLTCECGKRYFVAGELLVPIKD